MHSLLALLASVAFISIRASAETGKDAWFPFQGAKLHYRFDDEAGESKPVLVLIRATETI
jgi:hypothetical protein